jgi:hypothetical protein
LINQEKVLCYARLQADNLEKDMRWQTGEFGGGGWWTADEDKKTEIHARAVAALEFLRQYAGSDSHWCQRAFGMYESKGDNVSMEAGARHVGALLRAWADQVEAGITEVIGARAWAEVGTVSTDMMTQVRRLVEDRESHPAAAIILCGAALETSLRATVHAKNLVLPEKQRPSLNAYSQLLRSEGLFSAQDVKDCDQCGGLRNLAAHGHFEDLSRERAGLMEQQTNLLLRRLSDIAGVQAAAE